MIFHSLDMEPLATKRLRNAIVASLLAHTLILWPAGVRVLTKDTPALLQASLRTPPRPPPEQVPPAPPRARSATADMGEVPRVHDSRNRGASPGSPAPQLLVATPETVLKPPLPLQSARTGAAAPAVPAAAAAGAGASLTTDANAAGEAVEGLRGYRLALATQARRFKRYPAQAMASGWAGSADIRVEVGSDGRPLAATVARSSGYEVLDRAALVMIDAGALRARLPESLRGRAFAVVLPVVFNLDDE